MGGRFGKYGDSKRRKALRRSRLEKSIRAGATARALYDHAGSPLQTLDSMHAAAPAEKTRKSAVVIIPPQETWGPIQEIRRRFDRHYRRWMPHITLVYPFRPASGFKSLIPRLDRACCALAPFEIRLARFGAFDHGRGKVTLFLIPEPEDSLKALLSAILSVVPDCNDVCRFAGGYSAHLSVGQVRTGRAHGLRAQWQATWRPVSFTVTHICLVWRNNPPDDVFRTGPTVQLGGCQIQS